jgi:protein TonB
MSYADQKMSGNKVTALVIVAILHIILGYALVTGLAYDVVKKAVQRVTTVDIKEEVKKEPPPPPKKLDLPPPPPIVVPPPKTTITPPRQQITTVSEPPPPPPPIIVPPPPSAPPPPPPPRFTPKGATPKGSGQGNWVTTSDYPSRALNDKREGVTGYRVSVGPDGRVTDCNITSSSGSPELDDATCSNIRRRARFNPAMDGEGQPTSGAFSGRVRWQIPKD